MVLLSTGSGVEGDERSPLLASGHPGQNGSLQSQVSKNIRCEHSHIIIQSLSQSCSESEREVHDLKNKNFKYDSFSKDGTHS